MRRISKILLILIPLLIIIGAGAAALWREHLTSYLVPVIESQLSQALEREVRVGRITGGLARGAVLHDLRIADGERLQQGALLQARRVAVRYRLRDLVVGKQGAAAIDRVDVTGARLRLARDRTGKWNIAPLLKPRVPPVARFTGIINIADSAVVFEDESPPAAIKRPLSIALADVSGRVTPHPEQGMAFRVRAAVGEGVAESVEVTGASGAAGTALNIRIVGAGLAQWDRQLALSGIRMLAGTADIELSGAVREVDGRTSFDYLARTQVRDGAVTVAQIGVPLRALNGSAMIAPDQVRLLDLNGAAGGMPFSASGLIAGFKQPQLDLRVKADGLTTDGVARLAKLKLPAELAAQGGHAEVAVRGSLEHPVVEGTLRVEQGRFRSITASDLSAQALYRDGTVWLHGLRLDAIGGGITGDVWIRPGADQVEIAFEAAGSELSVKSALAAAEVESPRPTTGTAAARVAGTYDEDGLRIGGSFEARDGTFGDLAFSSASGVVEVNGGDVRIASGRVESPAGSAVVQGSVAADRALSLEIRASGVDLAAAARAAGMEDQQLGGVGYFAGALSGTIDEPTISGSFQVIDFEFESPEFERQAIAFLSGAVAASRTSVQVENALVYQEGARYVVSGSLEGLDRPQREDIAIAATVNVGYAHLTDLLDMAGIAADLDGDVEATVKIGGTIGAPTASGQVVVRRPVWNGWVLDSAEGQFELSDDTVRIAGATAQVADSTVTTSGQVSLEGDLQLAFAADVQLAGIRPPESVEVPPLDVAGRLTARGEINGTLEQPQITLDAQSEQVSVNGEEFTDIALEAAYAPETQRHEFRFAFAQGAGHFSLKGSTDWDAEAVHVTADVDEARLARLRRAIQAIGEQFAEDSAMWNAAHAAARTPSPVRGRLSAQAEFAGTWPDLAGEVKLQTTNASLAGAPLPDATASVGVEGRVVAVRSFEARQGDAYATATGTIDLDGPLSLEVDAYNLHAKLFDPWLDLPQEVGGSADVSLSVAGTLEHPEVVGSMEVARLSAGGVSVDNLQVPRFEVSGNSLVAEQINVAVGPHVLHASAAIPVSWEPIGIDRQGPLSVALDVTDQDLALLAELVPGIGSVSGSLDGGVELGGSIEEPELRRAIIVSGGTVRPRGREMEVTNLESTIQFAGRRIALEQLTGSVGEGAFRASGEASLVSLDPSQIMSSRSDFSVSGQGLDVDAGTAFKGEVDVLLKLASAGQEGAPPVLSGQVAVASGQLGIPRQPEVRPLIEAPPFNPRLDIDIVLGPSLRLRTSSISMEVSGTGHIGGRLGAPSASIIAESRRGVVDLPGASFRVTYASMEATVAPPRVPAPGMPAVADVRAYIRLDAESNVRGYRVYLTMSGPLTDPNVEPRIELRSTPAIDEESLWAMITGLPVGPGAPEASAQARALLTTGLGAALLSPLQRETAQALGLEELGVEYSQYEPLKVRLGGYVFEKLYATYLRSVSSTREAWDFRLAYQVLPTLSLGMRINERNETYWEAQTTRRF
ncbi:MAG: translocation/assembly module TamB domain-containing protein [Armatimonadota bacterium]|nr:MAG: translocation/assembly module TamB domain-containing protein [Armatimonadota bacterium]